MSRLPKYQIISPRFEVYGHSWFGLAKNSVIVYVAWLRGA